MNHGPRPDKAPCSQYLLQLGYDGRALYGVTPQAAGPSVWAHLCARLARAPGWSTPYAVSWAARTDRGVQALRNWVSFRLRDGGQPAAQRAILAAAAAPAADALTQVTGVVLPARAMARSLAVGKVYRYRLADTQQLGEAAQRRLEAAARALTGTLDVRRLAHPRATRHLVDSRRGGISTSVRADDADLIVEVSGPGFLRHQVRHMVQAMAAVMRQHVRLADLDWLARGQPGPLPEGLGGAAHPSGLCLVRLVPHPQFAPWLRPLEPPPKANAACP